MNKARNWSQIWEGVSAIATLLAVLVALWIGYKSNQTAERATEIANNALVFSKDASDSMEKFNEVQLKINALHFLKTMNDMFETEKMYYCREILGSYVLFFYLMSDKTDQELYDIAKIPFVVWKDSGHLLSQGYKLKDDDELLIVKNFLERYDNKKSQEFNFSNVQDAMNYLHSVSLLCGEMFSGLGLQGEEWENRMRVPFDNIDELLIDCLDHAAIYDQKYYRKRFPHYFKNEEKIHQELLERRGHVRNQVRKLLERKKIQQGAVPDFDFIKVYSRFIDKNDRGGKKGPAPAAEDESVDNATAKKVKEGESLTGQVKFPFEGKFPAWETGG